MESMDYWRLCDDLSVMQAALLAVGEDPADMGDVEEYGQHSQPKGYEAAKTAIMNALKRGEIEGKVIFAQNYNGSSGEDRVDIFLSTVSVVSVRAFLRKRGFSGGFFLPDDVDTRDFMDVRNPFFAPKLAAAVKAWEIVTSSPDLTNGKTPKQAVTKWLREHAHECGLTDDEGNPITAAIEEISKVANWKPEGGAARTPTRPQVAYILPTPSKSKEKPKVQAPLDDEIPF